MTPIEFKIRTLLNEKNMSLRAFCQAVPINTNTLYDIFKKGHGKIPTLQRMAEVLGVKEDDLLLPSVVYLGRAGMRDNMDKGISEVPESPEQSLEAIPLNFVDETEVDLNSSGMEFRDLSNGMVLMTMPLVDEFAYASYPSGWRDKEFVVELPRYSIVLPKRESGFYRAFEVRGDSMDDGSINSICFGDIAVGRLVDSEFWNHRLFTNGGTDYIIVTTDGIIVKRIIRHDIKDGVITCSSINPNKKEFPDFDIQLANVYELYKIRKVDRDWNRR